MNLYGYYAIDNEHGWIVEIYNFILNLLCKYITSTTIQFLKKHKSEQDKRKVVLDFSELVLVTLAENGMTVPTLRFVATFIINVVIVIFRDIEILVLFVQVI